MTVPMPLPAALAASTSPNTHAGSCVRFSANAAKNVKKPDDRPEQAHRGSRGDDAARVQRGALVGGLPRSDPLGPRDAERADRAEDEHDRTRTQHPRCTPTSSG